jgi:phytoene dehydrogenase-like protein
LPFIFKMMAEGSIVTPALGMGELARQLAGHLSPEQIRYQTPVERILAEDGKVRGIRTAKGEEIPAEWVVCATDAPQARAWQAELCPQAPTPIPTQGRAVTCLYFCAPFSLSRGAYLYLNATGQGWINHWVQLTRISPALAPSWPTPVFGGGARGSPLEGRGTGPSLPGRAANLLPRRGSVA